MVNQRDPFGKILAVFDSGEAICATVGTIRIASQEMTQHVNLRPGGSLKSLSEIQPGRQTGAEPKRISDCSRPVH